MGRPQTAEGRAFWKPSEYVGLPPTAAAELAANAFSDALADEFADLQSWLCKSFEQKLGTMQESLLAGHREAVMCSLTGRPPPPSLHGCRTAHPEETKPTPPQEPSANEVSPPWTKSPPSRTLLEEFNDEAPMPAAPPGLPAFFSPTLRELPTPCKRLAHHLLLTVWDDEWKKGTAEGRHDDKNTAAALSAKVHRGSLPTWLQTRRDHVLSSRLLATSDGSTANRDVSNAFYSGLMLWNVVGAFLILYDMIMLPMQVFELGQNSLTTAMPWIITMFWSIDLMLSILCGGCSQQGNSRHQLSRRAYANYLRTWFLPELASVVADWLTCTVSTDGGDTWRFTKAFRAIRLMQTMKLLRFVKLKRLCHSAVMRLDLANFHHLATVLKLVLSVLLLNHYIACGWYATSIIEGERGWLRRYSIDAADALYCYLVSFQWALSNFTGEADVAAAVKIERFFSIAVFPMCLLAFAFCIGVFARMLGEDETARQHGYQQRLQLSRYLAERKISSELGFRVQLFVEEVAKTSCRKHDEVALLEVLPRGLRQQLDYEIKVPAVCFHPLLEHMMTSSEHSGTSLCESLQCSYLHYGQELFQEEQLCDRIYLVVSGHLVYAKKAGKCFLPDVENHKEASRDRLCNRGEWLSEAALWTRWFHLGDCYSTTRCSVFSLRDMDLSALLPSLGERAWDAAKYAREFVQCMNKNAANADDLFNIFDGHRGSHQTSSSPVRPVVHSPSKTPGAAQRFEDRPPVKKEIPRSDVHRVEKKDAWMEPD